MIMELTRILCISRLSRVVSSRLTLRRCYLTTSRTEKTLRPGLCPPTAAHCTPRTSSWSSLSSAACGGPHSLVYTSYVQRSSVSWRTPCPVTAAQNPPGCSRSIHTTSRLNVLLPPHVWLFIKPLQKLFAIILGRSIRNWWKALPGNKRELFKETVRRNKWKLFLGAGTLGAVIILFYFTNLEETPITGRSRLLVFKKEDYDLLTSVEYENLMEEFEGVLLPTKDERYQLVQRIVDHLIACNQDLPEVSKIQWTLHVVDKPDVTNAFVLPNGQVFVYTGMLNAVADTEQLTFILGHELAHAILQHTAERASVGHFLDFFLLLSLAMIWALCPRDSLAIVGQWVHSRLREYLFERPYSRTLEAEADKVGLQLAAKACADVRSSSVFWKQMELVETLGGIPRIPEWLSTHPSHENRAEQLDRFIPKAIKLRESCNCPDLPCVDPRLVFELSRKQMLQNHRNSEAKVISGAALQVDDRVVLTAAVRGA